MHRQGNEDLTVLQKACAVPYRRNGQALEVLAFRHPLAGNQLVKGTIEADESPAAAAARELAEESGIVGAPRPIFLGRSAIGAPPLLWHVYAFAVESLPDRWDHRTEDGGGHVFSFFWHPLAADLDGDWHPIFHEGYRLIRAALPRAAR